MSHTLYIRRNELDNDSAFEAYISTVADIAHYLGEQGFPRPLFSIDDPYVVCTVEEEDAAFALKMRYPVKSLEQIERDAEAKARRVPIPIRVIAAHGGYTAAKNAINSLGTVMRLPADAAGGSTP